MFTLCFHDLTQTCEAWEQCSCSAMILKTIALMRTYFSSSVSFRNELDYLFTHSNCLLSLMESPREKAQKRWTLLTIGIKVTVSDKVIPLDSNMRGWTKTIFNYLFSVKSVKSTSRVTLTDLTALLNEWLTHRKSCCNSSHNKYFIWRMLNL